MIPTATERTLRDQYLVMVSLQIWEVRFKGLHLKQHWFSNQHIRRLITVSAVYQQT